VHVIETFNVHVIETPDAPTEHMDDIICSLQVYICQALVLTESPASPLPDP
jgi:hypothetical protein